MHANQNYTKILPDLSLFQAILKSINFTFNFHDFPVGSFSTPVTMHDSTKHEAKMTYFLIEVHKEKGSNLAHALAISNLSVVHGVSCQHMEQSLLPVQCTQQ